MRVLTLPGVLRPPSDCWLLIETLRRRGLARGADVLDVFTGTGTLAVAAAVEGAASAAAVDISRRAVLNARLNARLNRTRVRVLRGDLFAPVEGETFDLILANPPYVPGEIGADAARGPARAWEGGDDGRDLVDRFCAGAAAHLRPGGAVLMVHSSLTGEHESLAALRAAGLSARVAERSRGRFGPRVAARAELLERRGLIPAGAREEELLVFEAAA